MHHNIAANRYARALFNLASELNELDAVNADMILVDKTISDNREFELVLKSPIIKPWKKIEIVHAIFDSKISKTSRTFFDLILKKRREVHIHQIVRQFVVLFLERNGVEEVLLTTAHKIDEPFRKKIIQLVEQKTGSKVELEEKIDPSIIGGFILRYGDNQIDASLERDLESIRQEFSKNLYIREF